MGVHRVGWGGPSAMLDRVDSDQKLLTVCFVPVHAGATRASPRIPLRWVILYSFH